MRVSNVKEINKGGIVASFNLCYAGLTILGFKLVRNKRGGYFVSPPCQNINGKWLSDIRISDEVKNLIKEQVLEILTRPQE